MKILDWICAVVVLALGVVHCVFTPFAYPSFSVAALWFLGAGLALIFGGMLNVLRLQGASSPLARTFSAMANAGMLAFALLFAAQVSLARNPQGIVLIVVLTGEFLFSLLQRR